ncbi:hypothetical protein [Yoonia sp. R78084]|uniref:hypothetical protein n=1 Tax=Yoonia sp. R78084 TaxID=3093869 RepID=UPI0037DDAD53
MQIHYHGDGSEAEASRLQGLANKGGQAAFLDIHYHGKDAMTNVANPTLAGKAGQAAFLDIHYHGKDAMTGAVNPALAGKAGQAAFLDIHYHGKDAMGGGLMGESAEAEGGLISRSSMMAGAVEAPKMPAPQIGKGPGQAAFLDIHYHGKSITDADLTDKPGLHIGNAALLDIHYHG